MLLTNIEANHCYEQAVVPRPPKSEAQLKACIEAAKVDAIHQEKLKNAQAEISEEALEGVAGGTFTAGMNCTGNLPGGPITSRFHC